MGWATRVHFPVGTKIFSFLPRQDQPMDLPNLPSNGKRDSTAGQHEKPNSHLHLMIFKKVPTSYLMVWYSVMDVTSFSTLYSIVWTSEWLRTITKHKSKCYWKKLKNWKFVFQHKIKKFHVYILV
jgi:hypothetical protein